MPANESPPEADLQKARARIGASDQLMDQLLASFLADHAALLDGDLGALPNEQLCHRLHRLAGAAAALSADELARTSRELETRLLTNEPLATRSLQILRAQLSRVCQQFEQALDSRWGAT